MLNRLSLCVFSVLLLSSCLAQNNTPQQPAKPDASQEAVIIKDRSTWVRFAESGASSTTVRQSTVIQNEAGLKEYGILSFYFAEGQTLTLDTVEVHKKDGKVIKVGHENIQQVTPEVTRSAPMYSDEHEEDVTIPALSIGDELVYQYTRKEPPLVPNHFWFQYWFRRRTIVNREFVEVDVPQGRVLHHANEENYKPEIETKNNRTIYRWVSSNLSLPDPALERYTYRWEQENGTAPPPSIALSSFADWKQVGDWYYALYHERSKPTPAIRAKALELTKTTASREDKIRALYSYVATNIRYISLDFGIGGHQPHFAEQVLSNGYGDCKDKHTLLAALLEAVGIQAYPVLINSERRLNTSVPSLQFDHVISAIQSGQEITFLDATAEAAPFGMLVLPLRGKDALLVTGQSASRLVRTPQDPPFRAQETFSIDAKVDDAGTMEAEVEWFFHGGWLELYFKSNLRDAAPSHYQDIIQRFARTAGFDGQVSNLNITGIQQTDAGLRIRFHYRKPAYFDMTESSPRHSLPFAYSVFRAMAPDEKTLRLYNSPGDVIHKCRLELPAGVTAEIPLPVKLDREYLHYEASYTLDKNVITGEKKITVIQPEISEAHRDDYDAFRRSVEADEGQQVVLRLPPGFIAKNNSTEAIAIDELASRADMEYKEANFDAALADYRAVAERDPRHKGVWTNIGMIEVFRHSYQNAIKDLEKAVEMDPFDAQAHAELGYMYLTAKQDDQGVRELKKAAEIDPLSHRAYYLIGWYYALRKKDYPSAIIPLEKALATDEPRFNDAAELHNLLTTAYFSANEPEKGTEILKQTVAASPEPVTWNNAAYTLAENGQHLELAKRWAEQAIAALYKDLQGADANALHPADFQKMALLTNTWDTLGWAYFKAGDALTAEKYVRAAWNLGEARVVGEHLGEIHEKLGNVQLATVDYARNALPFTSPGTPGSDPGTQNLVRLVGKDRAEQLIQQHSGDSWQHGMQLGKVAGPDSRGEFVFVFSPGPTLKAVHRLTGDESLLPQLQKMSAKIIATVLFPDAADYKIIRIGSVMCYSYGCDLAFYSSDVALSPQISQKIAGP